MRTYKERDHNFYLRINRGVPSAKPRLVFGNEYDLYSGQKSFADHYIDVYKANKQHRSVFI